MRRNAMTAHWEIVCPDGRVRHLPYRNRGDADVDAELCEERHCQIYDGPLDVGAGPCPGGPHRVRLSGSASTDLTDSPN